MTRIPREMPWVAALLVVGVIGLGLLEGRTAARAELEAETARADSLASEKLIEAARADGWAARWATETDQLLAERAGRDSAIAQLERELAAARARPIARVDVAAAAEGELEFPSIEDFDAPAAPDSASAEFADGPLSGRVSYRFTDESFRLQWRARVPLELVLAESADDRLLVLARSADPRIQVDVAAAEYQRPPPIIVKRADPKWVLAGFAAGVVACALAC